MKESPFGFEYTREDLRPVRPLVLIVAVFQICGALMGLWIAKYPQWFANIWAGGALATFPGFVVWLGIQRLRDPDSLTKHRVMVRRLGLIAALLSLFVFVMPFE